MIIKIFNQGQGKGDFIVKYLLSEEQHQNFKPEILEGNPLLTKSIINSLNFKNKYITGVISFKQGEQLTAQQQHKLIEDFQKTFCPFEDQGRVNFLWIKHFDKGRLEMHFLSPRCAFLDNGQVKSFCFHPPGKANQLFFNSFTILQNLKFGFEQVDKKQMTAQDGRFYLNTLKDLIDKRKDFIYNNYDKIKIRKVKNYARTNKSNFRKYSQFRNLHSSIKSKIEFKRNIFGTSSPNSEGRPNIDNGIKPSIATTQNITKSFIDEIQAFNRRKGTGGQSRKSTSLYKGVQTSAMSLQEQLRSLGMQLNECEPYEAMAITTQINQIKGQIEREQWIKPKFK